MLLITLARVGVPLFSFVMVFLLISFLNGDVELLMSGSFEDFWPPPNVVDGFIVFLL
jgi:hypothetical protein